MNNMKIKIIILKFNNLKYKMKNFKNKKNKTNSYKLKFMNITKRKKYRLYKKNVKEH